MCGANGDGNLPPLFSFNPDTPPHISGSGLFFAKAGVIEIHFHATSSHCDAMSFAAVQFLKELTPETAPRISTRNVPSAPTWMAPGCKPAEMIALMAFPIDPREGLAAGMMCPFLIICSRLPRSVKFDREGHSALRKQEVGPFQK
jgi:hypothetical protein